MKPDKKLISDRFGRKFEQYNNLARIQQGIAAELAKLYAIHFPVPVTGRIFEAGAGTGFLTRFLRMANPGAEFILNDITDAAAPYLREAVADSKAAYLWGDAESIELPRDLHTVAAASTVQWFDDLPGFLRRAASATVEGGALAISTFGPDNFREVRSIMGFGLDYHTKAELGSMAAEAGYEVVHLSEQTRTLYFDIPVDIIYHIRTTGVNAVRPVQWDRRKLTEFTERYRELFMTRDGLMPLTYHPVFLIARRKAAAEV
ncbi:MAG: methyltransferase domain-containing protein [Alistipes sp.]|nr:methyltransferase domain-containing protein [Alistipes sp.]